MVNLLFFQVTASPQKLSLLELQRLIRQRCADPGAVFFTTYSRLRMLQRHVSMALVLDVLREGQLRRSAEPDPRHGSVVCRMEHVVAGRELAAVVALGDEEPGVVVVTIIDLAE